MKTIIVFGAVVAALCATWIPFVLSSKWYKIRHSGLCVMVGGNNILVTSIHRNDPLTWFELDQISTLKDANGLCILPVQLSDNHFYLQAKNSCPDPYAARYYQTAGYSLKHVNSGNCWHARDIPARDNTPIILNPTCDVPIAKFILSSS